MALWRSRSLSWVSATSGSTRSLTRSSTGRNALPAAAWRAARGREAQEVRAAVVGVRRRSTWPRRLEALHVAGHRRRRRGHPIGRAPTASSPPRTEHRVDRRTRPQSRPVGASRRVEHAGRRPGDQPHVEQHVRPLGRHAHRMGLDRCTAISHYLDDTTKSHYLEGSAMQHHDDHHRRQRPDDFLTVRHLRCRRTQPRDRRGPSPPRPGGRPRRRGRPRRPSDPLVERVRRRWFDAAPPDPGRADPGRSPSHFGLDSETTTWRLDWLATYDAARRVLGRLLPGRRHEGRPRRAVAELRLPHRHLHPAHRACRRCPGSGRWPPTRGWSSCTPTTATRRWPSGSWT